EGDGAFSISEFAAYCRPPTPFPPALKTVEAPMAVGPKPADEKPSPATAAAPRAPFGPLEITLAVGILALAGANAYRARQRARAPHGVSGLMLRGLFAAICLIPPTVMMGATLPAVARWVETTPRGVSWLGYFYGGNTIGAVFGCLLAGFYLLRVHDMPTATFVA